MQGDSNINLRSCARHGFRDFKMKKLFLVLFAIATMGLVSCGNGDGKSSSDQVIITLDELDDYFTVKSYKLETNVAEKGIEHMADAKGTLTLVLKRNKEEMKLKPSDIKWADLEGGTVETSTKVFGADIEGVVRKLVKLEPGTEETLEIPVKIYDPFNRWNSDEENQKNRQAHYDALTGVKGALSEISFVITLKDDDDDDW